MAPIVPLPILGKIRVVPDTTIPATITAALARAHSAQARLNAFVTIMDDEATARAATVSAQSVLAGEPIIVKDNINTRGVRTTAASRMLEMNVPTENATVVERLEQAGGIIIAKANLDEFGMGATGETSAFGPTKHPVEPALAPGGSSSGSAAAVAAGVARVALGTDTGGSVRQPAAFCRVYGYKPTYGIIPRTGVIPYTSTLDSVGLITSELADIARIAPVLAGADGHDDTVRISSWDDLPAPADGPLTLGVVRQFAEFLDDEMRTWWDDHLATLPAGTKLVEVDIPLASHTSALYAIIANTEGASNFARFTGMLFGRSVAAEADGQEQAITDNRSALLGSEVKKRLIVGTHLLGHEQNVSHVEPALRLREQLRQEVEAAFTTVDAIITPTVNRDPFALGEDRSVTDLRHTLGDRMLNLANLAGCCAVSLPGMGTTYRGVQVLAGRERDKQLLAAAEQLDATWRQ